MVAVQQMVYDFATGMAAWVGVATHDSIAAAADNIHIRRQRGEIVRLVPYTQGAPLPGTAPFDCNPDGAALLERP